MVYAKAKVSSLSRLLALYRFNFLTRHPFNLLGSKQHLIDDLMAKHPSVNGTMIANADEVKNVLACHSTWMLAIRCEQLKLHDLANSWAQQSTVDVPAKFTTTTNTTTTTTTTTTNVTLPFYLDNKLPDEAKMTANAITLNNGTSLLFEWYTNFIFQVEDLIKD